MKKTVIITESELINIIKKELINEQPGRLIAKVVKAIGKAIGGTADDASKIKPPKSNPSKSSFFKSKSDRTTPVRYGKSYTIEQEFEALKNMYKVDPNHVVKPISLTNSGYSMENLGNDFYSIRDFVDKGGKLSNQLIGDIKNTVNRLHNSGFAHGDLTQNIIILDKGKTFKITDPVGFPHSSKFPEFRQAISQDLSDLQRALSYKK